MSKCCAWRLEVLGGVSRSRLHCLARSLTGFGGLCLGTCCGVGGLGQPGAASAVLAADGMLWPP